MKMRVRGYDEHRLKDPYKFWSKVLDTPPKRKKKGVATYTYVSRLDEHTLRFTMGTPEKDVEEQKLLCTLADNDVWTIHVKPEVLMPSDGNRIAALAGCWPAWNKKSFSMYENACRFYKNWSRSGSIPYVPGVQVYRGKTIKPEQYVDRKRIIGDTDAADAVKQKLKKVRELAPIMIRLLEAHDVKDTTWDEGKKIKQEMLREFDLENITALDAERVFRVGQSTTGRAQRSWYDWSTKTWMFAPLESDDQYRRRCIVSGLRKLREHIYSKEGVYQFKPVK